VAFDVTKFQKKYKQVTEENARFKQQLGEFEQQKAADVTNAVQAAVTPLRMDIQQLRADVAHEQRKVTAGELEKQLLADRIVELDDTITKQRNAMAIQAEALEDLQTRFDAQQPAVQVAQQQVADLLDQLRKFEDKMSRREQERVAAIENRKILAAAVPSRNRG
jgi:chromosome segregation ATPase